MKQLKYKIMEHLTFEQARQEITVLNALIKIGVVETETNKSNEVLIEEGVKLLLNNNSNK